jgi:hypothetical protein
MWLVSFQEYGQNRSGALFWCHLVLFGLEKDRGEIMRTKIIGLLGFGIAVGLVGPSNSEETWVKTANQDCVVQGDEALKSNEIVSWSGSCDDGRASGVGKLEWIVDNKLAGIYEGRMAGGKLEGKGILRLEVEKGKGFDRLEGTFVAGEPEGEARYEAANGGYYLGGFKNGERHGTGYYKLVNGEEYYGDFVDGQREGVGFLIDSETDVYFGQFEKDQASGAGIFESSDGSSYQGKFKDNLPDGAGTYVAANGDTYQGSFKAGKADGKFLVTKANGDQAVEEQNNGELVK